jgi:hypothetical protein
MRIIILSSTFQNTPQLCCGDEWFERVFLRSLILRRKVLDLFLAEIGHLLLKTDALK